MSETARAQNRVPEWFPTWAERLSELYFSGATSVFVVSGNVQDLVRGQAGYVSLADFVTEQVFGRWDLILYYDLARGLRAFAGRDGSRLKEMVVLANRRVGDLSLSRKDPGTAFAMLDRFVQNNIMAEQAERLSAAILIDHASFLIPVGEPGRLSLTASSHIVTLLNWAASPHLKQMNMAFLLVDEQVAAVSERITRSPHVAAIDIPLPNEAERKEFIDHVLGNRDFQTISDYGPVELARLTAGLALIDLNTIIRSGLEGGQRLDSGLMRRLKKELIERQCRGLVEFLEPSFNLDFVVGHEGAKQRLREDAALLKRGDLHTLPMGYLVCGAVGTGKSFLAQCMAGEIGIPCLLLKNFRSKYVGESEGNLERVLNVLRAMGPVVVVIDEADAALGDRSNEGDSGTSNRIFSMIASQMGDTRYRGRILWMLLTSRPDLLPIDLKRQGRAEIHIPLFYPSDANEVRGMFGSMARKVGAKISLEDLPELPSQGKLSGADIEAIVGRAWRRSLLTGSDHITREALGEAARNFMPSTQGAEKDLQEMAAILECTDVEFLPPDVMKKVDLAGGREKLQERYAHLRQLTEFK